MILILYVTLLQFTIQICFNKYPNTSDFPVIFHGTFGSILIAK
jgi:hypothetical protein